jgi:hypothetical protein
MKGFIVGFFDAFKGMFGGKTDVPVNADNTNNETAAINPVIPATQSPETPEVSNNESDTDDPEEQLNTTNETANTNVGEVSTSRSPTNQPNNDAVNSLTPSADTTSSPADTESTTDDANISFPAPSETPDVTSPTNTTVGGNEPGVESNSGSFASQTPVPGQANNIDGVNVNQPAINDSSTLTTENSDPPVSSTSDTTMDTKEQTEETEPLSSPNENVDQAPSQDKNNPSKV